ncbi:MAG: thiamine pyrophosphate-dependent dehydrogenase E1 component subunit alpha [Elusimicrobia bacterium]|nr:thiamine pyrophosphate-dependent dehydrogenase E1 component subunit alpha [Elusimicrobiota bacterium]
MQRAVRLDLYRRLLRLRLVEERIAELYPQQEMRCPVHLSIGQEAAAVGVCAALEKGDWSMSGHRPHAHYLAMGGDLNAMMAELYGRATGCCGGKGGSMHLIDRKAGFMGATAIVASTIPMAVGAAFGSQVRGEKRVVVSFLGDAAVEEGVFHEAANFAVLKKLPVVFACENNLYSVYSGLGVRQPKGRVIHRQAASYGMKALAGDGNDVEESLALARQAVAWARSGKGPVFLELATYRWREHCGPNYDNDLGYRTMKEYRAWRKLCPLEAYERVLRKAKLLGDAELGLMRKDIAAELDAAVRFAKDSPAPDPKTLMTDVYAGAA